MVEAIPVAAITNVSKRIKGQTIVDDVSLQLQAGEVVTLCGANGAGKSTLLRMLAGILQPTEGTIRILGTEWRLDRRTYANQLGFMPDDYRFGNGLTARETLAFWASLRGLPEQRVEEVLEEVGLAHTGKKPVSSFSKGMRQRILFAQALLARPPLLVLDEPTNGLDPYWMESFVVLIQSLKRAGHTVLFSTHQLQIAESVADRAVFMEQGRLVLDDSLGNIRQRLGESGLQLTFAGIRSVQAASERTPGINN